MNRNAFIADLLDLNVTLEEMGSPKKTDSGYRSLMNEYVYIHFGFSSRYIREGFSETEIRNLIKLYVPEHYEVVTDSLLSLIEFEATTAKKI